MYIIREPEAQKIRYFAEMVENGQKTPIFTTTVVNIVIGEFQRSGNLRGQKWTTRGQIGVRSRLPEGDAPATNSVDRALTPIWFRGVHFSGSIAHAPNCDCPQTLKCGSRTRADLMTVLGRFKTVRTRCEKKLFPEVLCLHVRASSNNRFRSRQARSSLIR